MGNGNTMFSLLIPTNKLLFSNPELADIWIKQPIRYCPFIMRKFYAGKEDWKKLGYNLEAEIKVGEIRKEEFF